jgi:hypothetical protein
MLVTNMLPHHDKYCSAASSFSFSTNRPIRLLILFFFFHGDRTLAKAVIHQIGRNNRNSFVFSESRHVRGTSIIIFIDIY